MNGQPVRKTLYVSFVLVLMMVQSACAGGSAQPAAPEVVDATEIVNTFTPVATSTPADTPTPQATATVTETPLPTATFTPNVTATLLPEITPAVEGKGNVVGLVTWNNQPVAKAAVWMCEKFEGGCKGLYQYRTNTDQNGYYIFKNVTPGKYVVAVNSFSTGWFIFYSDANGSEQQQVVAGEDLILNPLSIWKFDLRPLTPKNRQVMSNAHPTFTWEPYPDAAYYEFSIYDNNINVVLENKRVDGSEYTLTDATLETCNYYWTVKAYNEDGLLISHVKGLYMYFINADLPGTC